MFVAPQYERLKEVDIVGVMLSVRPVQARRTLRWVTFQSVVPSSWRMQKDVFVDWVEMSREVVVVEVSR